MQRLQNFQGTESWNGMTRKVCCFITGMQNVNCETNVHAAISRLQLTKHNVKSWLHSAEMESNKHMITSLACIFDSFNVGFWITRVFGIETERMWKEMIVACFKIRIIPGFVANLAKNMKNQSQNSRSADRDQTPGVKNMKQECQPLHSNLWREVTSQYILPT
jgi:hypothetical protein